MGRRVCDLAQNDHGVGSVIYGEEAVRLGIIDEVGGLDKGLEWLYRKMEDRK